MTAYTLWCAIAGVQMSEHAELNTAGLQAYHLINSFKHSHAYTYDTETQVWCHYSKGIRGRVNECDIPEDEVPKEYRFLVMLGG